MRSLKIFLSASLAGALLSTSVAAMQDGDYERISPPRELTEKQATVAAANYKKYCVLCHGENREGYTNDHAPSLRSKSLFESGVPHEVLRALSYGREGTAMGGYLDEIGGPLTLDETWDLTYWLFWQSGMTDRVRIRKDLIEGDIDRGARLYADNCTTCHGKEGEGVTAPAIANKSALAHNSDEFLHYAIKNGRDGTPMEAWKDRLSDEKINDLVAFLRSRQEGWEMKTPILKPLPTPDQYILNPDNEDAQFDLMDGRYVMAADLDKALREKKRIVLLDTRVASVWQRVHIEGSAPVPYYTEDDEGLHDLPKDVMIVAYCSCPRAASDYFINKLREIGYENTAVMYEGIFGWMNMGYPVVRGEYQ